MRSKLYGIGSFLPAVLLLISCVLGFYLQFANDGKLEESDSPLLPLFLIGTILAVILTWVYIISMMIHAGKHLSGTDRVVWMVLLYMLNMFVFPIYWFRYVRIS